MKLFVTTFILGLAVTETVGSSWLSRAIYNKYHETELERWLSDHDIPYPSPATRRDLENTVKANWEAYVKGPATYTADQATTSLDNAKEWIFDTWSESQLKSFLDRYGVPNPQPKRKDTLLAKVRESYESIAQSLGQTTLYPGNWLYEQWSESDLKEWLDSRGYTAPQPTTRDKLIAAVRRNARRARIEADRASASASSSMAAAQETLTEALFNAWSESDFKKFFDEHGIKVPQGSKRNEMIALARKHRASLVDKPTASATSVWGAATSNAGNEYARATDSAQLKLDDLFNSAIEQWSDSRLKAYLDARGVPVPQHSKRDELLAKVRLHRHKAATGYSAWTFDTWNRENLGKYLSDQHKSAVSTAGLTRDELVQKAQDAYNSASKTGGSNYASVTSYLASATASAKDTDFTGWSKAELESYLASFGIKTRPGSVEALRQDAKRQADFFKHGTLRQDASIFARVQGAGQWLWDQLKIGALSGRAEGQKAAESAKNKAAKATKRVSDEL